MGVQTLEDYYTEMALLRQREEHAKAAVNNQDMEDDLKLLLIILYIVLESFPL